MHFTFLICFQFFLCNFFGLSFSYVTKVSQFRKSKKINQRVLHLQNAKIFGENVLATFDYYYEVSFSSKYAPPFGRLTKDTHSRLKCTSIAQPHCVWPSLLFVVSPKVCTRSLHFQNADDATSILAAFKRFPLLCEGGEGWGLCESIQALWSRRIMFAKQSKYDDVTPQKEVWILESSCFAPWLLNKYKLLYILIFMHRRELIIFKWEQNCMELLFLNGALILCSRSLNIKSNDHRSINSQTTKC